MKKPDVWKKTLGFLFLKEFLNLNCDKFLVCRQPSRSPFCFSEWGSAIERKKANKKMPSKSPRAMGIISLYERS